MRAPWQGFLYIDISDLFQYAPHNATLSGIQRVALLTISKILERYENPPLRLIAYHPHDRTVNSYDADPLRDGVFDQRSFCRIFSLEEKKRTSSSVQSYLAKKYGSRNISRKFHFLRLRLSNWLDSGETFEKRGIYEGTRKVSGMAGKAPPPIPGDTIFVPGATWTLDVLLNYLTISSRQGVNIIQFVHDLIPIIMPEHAVEGSPEQFSDMLSLMAGVADQFIVNSDCTRKDLIQFQDAYGFEKKPVSIVKLAHEFAPRSSASPAYRSPKWLADDFRGNGHIRTFCRSAARLPFVLCVGTIEVRKNVWTLVRAWMLLAQELGGKMPRLVFAGKFGWGIEDFDDLMRATGNVGGLVRIVERPDDAELEFLYRTCRFSVFLSYYEGWGLPVGESLWCGTPVLASSTSSIPEVGGAAVDYADPYSLDDILKKLRCLITDDAYLARRAAEVRAMPKRTWADVAEDLVTAIGEVGCAEGKRAKAISIKSDYADAFNSHGVTLGELRRFDEVFAGYELIADNQELRNGHSGFRRVPTEKELPIHFFTIVLNGQPWIRYHEQALSSLPFKWHWHIVEGVASLSHDTSWSVASGGRVEHDIHLNGRSKDGTSEYLDELAACYPANITIYRKPLGTFWDGKREMVNAPLPNINEECLLWQIDIDELWTADQIKAVRSRFLAEPQRTAAFYWCWYFVGPDKVISTKHNYAQNPAGEWLRTWRFRPGDVWAAHEPPTLVRPGRVNEAAVNIADICSFSQDETEAFGAVFQHYSYATEEQVSFKESYYGYAGAVEQWRALQASKGSDFLSDYLGWVTDRTMFDDAHVFGIPRLAEVQKETGKWSFVGSGARVVQNFAYVRPRVVIDGIYWQYLNSGIGGVWEDLLKQWVRGGFTDNVIVLDRAGTAPRIKGVHYQTIQRHDYERTGADSLYLERICRELQADLFVSTYYSTPAETPSLFFGFDMIPEVIGLDLSEKVLQEKTRAIMHAATHSMVSSSSARELAKRLSVALENITVAYCGTSKAFRPSDAKELAAARIAMQLPERYALMVGERTGAVGYKNGVQALKALEAAQAQGLKLSLVCVGGLADLEPDFCAAAPSIGIRRISVSDEELRLLFAGAYALIYPSCYKGFGLPIVEAMACGCPVITCPNSSLIEVGGDAAIFVDPNNTAALVKALLNLADPSVRMEYVSKGFVQAARFTVEVQATTVASSFKSCLEKLTIGAVPRPGSGWREFRSYQAQVQEEVQNHPEVAAQVSAASPSLVDNV